MHLNLPVSKKPLNTRYPDPKPLGKDQMDLFEPFVKMDVTIINKISTGETRRPGSNAWVISGKSTQSGHPILANDPHLELNLPATFMLVKLKTPTLQLAGGALPGSPYVIIGHNQHVAWGMTNSHVDQSDLLYVKKPKFKGHLRKEVIHVKGQDDVTIDVRDVKNGRVIGSNKKVKQG